MMPRAFESASVVVPVKTATNIPINMNEMYFLGRISECDLQTWGIIDLLLGKSTKVLNGHQIIKAVDQTLVTIYCLAVWCFPQHAPFRYGGANCLGASDISQFSQ